MEHLTTVKAGAVAAALVMLFVAERIWPAARQPLALARLGRNFTLAFINFGLGPLIVIPVSAYAAAHGLGLRPVWWNPALDVLALDLWIYLWHRANHVVPLLWRFHEVHHLDEALDTSTGFRFHFGEVMLSALVRAAVIWLLAMPLQSVIIFETMLAVVTLLQHSNLRLPTRLELVLSKLIVTPRLHWVHHHALRRDTDSNYASILSIWDIVFASRSPTQRFGGMALGVEGRAEEPLPQLITRPFRPS